MISLSLVFYIGSPTVIISLISYLQCFLHFFDTVCWVSERISSL